jgi:hypothetical protein
MRLSRLFAIAVIALLLVGSARAISADISGTWKATFETQIGTQNYTYQFVVKDKTLTGKIESDMGGKSEIQQGKIDGDQVSFVETFKYQGMDITITYTGKVVSADEIKFTRQVAEFASEELVAKRAK